MTRWVVTWAIFAALAAPSPTLAQPGAVGLPGQGGAGAGVARPLPPRDPRGAEPRGTSVLRGFVVAADTGSPIRRAQVRLSGQGLSSRIATTDADGRFEIRELPAGRYTLSASKGGFVTLQYGQRRPSESGTPIEIADSQIVERLVIALPRGSVISGRIMDEFGEPVANAVVTALRYGYAAGARRLVPAAGGNTRDTTDDLGSYRLFGLPPGEYIVSAALRTGVEVTDPAGDPTGYAPTYYPGTPDIAEAQRVSVAVGQEQSGVSFGLITTRLVRVSGSVLSSHGAPVINGVVLLAPPNARGAGLMMQAASARLDGSGQFRITNVVPGRYRAQVRAARGGRGGPFADGEFGRLDLTVGGSDLDGVVIVTGPPARVTGRITTDLNTPPSLRPSQVQIAARLVEPDQALPGGGGGAARVNDDWTFELNGLFDARLFRAGLPQGWTLKAVLLDGDDITDTPLDLAPGQTVSGLRVVITDRVTEVYGRITDTRGAPVTDVTIVIFPADETRWGFQSRFIRTARPDQEGGFQIRGLPPADRYLVVPSVGLEEGQASDPEFLARVRDQAVAFSLNEGESRALDLRIDAR
jgi:hypothetical protein